MTEDVGLNRLDNFRTCCPWMMLPRAIRYATSVQVMLLAALGAMGNAAGWRIAASLTIQPDSQITELGQDLSYLSAWPHDRDAPMCPFSDTSIAISNRLVPPPADPIVSVPYRIVRPFAQMLNRTLSARGHWYYLLGGGWTLLLWSFLGSAITRIATMQFGRDQQISLSEALAHARSKVGAHLAACTVPIAVVLMAATLLYAMGFVAKLGIGSTLVGAFWFVPLAGSVVMAVILVGLLFGWPLIWGAINTERSDSFDGMSRAYAYAYHRPLTYIAMLALAAAAGYVGWLFVWLVSELIIQLGVVVVGAGAGSERLAELLGESGTESMLVSAGGAMVRFWNGVIRTFASAFGFGYFWCAMAGIYLLLRLDVDAAELDDISTDDAPSKFGLPPIDSEKKTDGDVA